MIYVTIGVALLRLAPGAAPGPIATWRHRLDFERHELIGKLHFAFLKPLQPLGATLGAFLRDRASQLVDLGPHPVGEVQMSQGSPPNGEAIAPWRQHSRSRRTDITIDRRLLLPSSNCTVLSIICRGGLEAVQLCSSSGSHPLDRPPERRVLARDLCWWPDSNWSALDGQLDCSAPPRPNVLPQFRQSRTRPRQSPSRTSLRRS